MAKKMKVEANLEASRQTFERVAREWQRASAVFVYAIAQSITLTAPTEKLGAVFKPLRKGRQPAITDLVPLRNMILAYRSQHRWAGAFV